MIDEERRSIGIERVCPIYEKTTWTISEAAEVTGIGENKLRELANSNYYKKYNFVLSHGNRRLIKREAFNKFIEQVEYI